MRNEMSDEQKEIAICLHEFYYPLKKHIQQCINKNIIMKKDDLQKFITLKCVTGDVLYKCKEYSKNPTKDMMVKLFWFLNRDINHYEAKLNK